MEKIKLQSPLLIILNPNAAKGKAAPKQKIIEDYLTKYGINYVLEVTKFPFQAIELAEKGVEEGYKSIIAAGGDGTVNEVVDGVMRKATAMNLSFEQLPVIGILPIGRGNDFAYIAKIPKKLEEALKLAVKGDWVKTDYGKLHGGQFPQGRSFVNGVGIGFEPLVNYEASAFKKIGGMVSYFLGLLRVLINYPKAVDLTIKVDDQIITCSTQQISVCNGRRMGSAFLMAPEAIIDDGLLDVVYANRPLKRHQILFYATKFLKGTQLKSETFSFVRAKEVVIATKGEKALVCHTDGEGVSRGCSSIEVKIYHHGLKLIRKI